MIETQKSYYFHHFCSVCRNKRFYLYSQTKIMANFEYFSLRKKPLIFLKKWYIPYVFIYLYKTYEKNKNKTKIFFQLNFLQEMSS